MKRIRYLLLVAASFTALTLLFTGLIVAARAVGRASESELLVYSGDRPFYLNDARPIMLFDVKTKLRFAILPHGASHFAFGGQGKLAFTPVTDNSSNPEIFVLDTTDFRGFSATPIGTVGIPLSWSPDGRYLAFVSRAAGQEPLLFVWDGQNTINITPPETFERVISYFPVWSADGRLAITAFFEYTTSPQPNEIYFWNGNTTVNLSQNPNGNDSIPAWSDQGSLAFLSEREGVYRVVVWNGVTTENGSPDVTSFVEVGSELRISSSIPIWTNMGQLVVNRSIDQNTQILLWEDGIVTTLTQNSSIHHFEPRWSVDGYWAVLTLVPSQPQRMTILNVYNPQNELMLSTAGFTPPAWNTNGHLLFCQSIPNSEDSVLYIWDRNQLIYITSGYQVFGQWQNGERTLCYIAG